MRTLCAHRILSAATMKESIRVAGARQEISPHPLSYSASDNVSDLHKPATDQSPTLQLVTDWSLALVVTQVMSCVAAVRLVSEYFTVAAAPLKRINGLQMARGLHHSQRRQPAVMGHRRCVERLDTAMGVVIASMNVACRHAKETHYANETEGQFGHHSCSRTGH